MNKKEFIINKKVVMIDFDQEQNKAKEYFEWTMRTKDFKDLTWRKCLQSLLTSYEKQYGEDNIPMQIIDELSDIAFEAYRNWQERYNYEV